MSGVRTASLRDPAGCREAARLLRGGKPIGVYGRSVASIWVDPTNEEGVKAVYRVKGARRTGMPLGMVLERDDLPRLIDPDLIAPQIRALFLNGSDLAARLSTLVWIRFPLRASAAAQLPACLLSITPDGVYWGQGWITDEGDAHRLLAARLGENGVKLLAPTSMNVSGEPEIVNAEDGEAFCARHDIPLYLQDPDDGRAVQGSYPIIEVNRQGVRLVREGHFPTALLSDLLGGTAVDTDNRRPAKFPLLRIPLPVETHPLSAYQLHDEIQLALNTRRQAENNGG